MQYLEIFERVVASNLFPMLLSVFLLVRLELKIEDLTKSIHSLSHSLEDK